MIHIGILLIATLMSLAITPAVRRLAVFFDIMDKPARRKVHSKPVPRCGGLAVVFAWLVSLFAGGAFIHLGDSSGKLLMVMAIGLAVVLLGLWDDQQELSGKGKLLGQVVIASLTWWVGLRIDRISNPLGGSIYFPQLLSYTVTVLWVVGMMNAVNLIDGLDGLACGIGVVASLGLILTGAYVGAATSVVMLSALAGACLGFLWYNFYPASIFLGDSGSQFIGFIFAAVALVDDQYKSATAIALLVPLTALALPIYDTALAIFRRFKGHRSIFHPDKYHLHHRLLKMGLSQKEIVYLFYLISLYLAALAFMFVLISDRFAFMLLILLALGMLIAMQTLRIIEVKLRQRYRLRRAP